MFNDYQIEQNQVLEKLLSPIFKSWEKDISYQEDFFKNAIKYKNTGYQTFSLEIFVTPNCNQNCSYCYLQKNKKDIYPEEINNKELILNNLRILLEYFLEKKYHLAKLDIFSGEIWGTSFGKSILDILIEYLEKGLDIKTIIIPSNCSFCNSPDILNFIELYIQKFEKLNSRLCFSISFDGPLVENLNRPFNNNQNKDVKYIENIFNFAKKYYFGFHPMIDASTIEFQKQNYVEWLKYIEKYYGPNIEDYYGMLMQLEVRSNQWTDEKIIYYLDWLNFLIEMDLKIFFKDNLELLGEKILTGTNPFDNFFSNSYIPYMIQKSTSLLGCSLGNSLCIRLGDLAIIPCHRTSYKKFNYGNFIIENDKIVGIKANNISLANAIFQTGFYTKPKCATCLNNISCLKSCLGANYEFEGDLFYPIEENCNLQKAKNIFIYEKYKSLGLFEIAPQILENNEFKNIILLEEQEEKWTVISRKIILDN